MTKHELGIWQKLTSESETNLEARIKFDNLINNKMNTQFKTLRGRRILIEVPVRKESAIKLSEKVVPLQAPLNPFKITAPNITTEPIIVTFKVFLVSYLLYLEKA